MAQDHDRRGGAPCRNDDAALAATETPVRKRADAAEATPRSTTDEYAHTVTDFAAVHVAPVESDDDDSLIGQRLAHFYVEALLGEGGMGRVYRATDLALDRPVAIKVLAPAIADHPELRARFWREARAQARLRHPNICHIYFIGEQRGQLYFAMELIEGETLAKRLERVGRLPAGEAVDLCLRAARGLREAQRHGFLHRDVKPSNILIDSHDTVKLLDFGLVQSEGDGSDQDTVLGTPYYMSPEQSRGEAVDFRSDIYSLGATLHHLIAGTPPFGGPDADTILGKHRTQPRPRLPSGRRSSDNHGLEQLCDRMMAKDPAERPRSYDQLIAWMEKLSPSHSRPAGVWVRGFAGAIDWMIPMLVTTLSIGWLFDSLPDVLPVLAIAAYFIGGHAFFGTTLGKRLLELEVVSSSATSKLGVSRATVRFLASWGTVLVPATLADLVPDDHPLSWAIVGLIVVGALYLIGGGIYAGTSASRRTPWDLLARTSVRYRRR